MATQTYRTQVDRLIAEGSGEILLNGSAAHASIIVERMFTHARNCVRILSRRLDPRIYGGSEIVEAATLYSSVPERKIKILLESEKELEAHPLLKAVFDDENVQIKLIPEFLHESVGFNFSTMDDYGTRFEENKSEAVAIAQFGNDQYTKRLNDLFDRLWNLSSDFNSTDKTLVA